MKDEGYVYAPYIPVIDTDMITATKIDHMGVEKETHWRKMLKDMSNMSRYQGVGLEKNFDTIFIDHISVI
jgi:hypothetical protein